MRHNSWVRRLLTVLCLLLPAAQAGNITLVYHDVGQGTNGTLGISATELRERVEALRRLGYRFVTSSQIHDFPGQKTATLEFDDGFSSVYEQAFPALRALGVPGSVYPILDLVGAPGHMTWGQLNELGLAGWEIGSHTRHHADLSALTPPSIRAELNPAGIDEPQRRCLAYPFSLHDARVRRLTAQVYGCGVAGAQGSWGERYALPGPQITPWDNWLLPYRAPLGLDARAPMLAAGLGLLARDALRASASGEPPRFWNPARFEMLGSGEYKLWLDNWGRGSLLAQRSGQMAFSALATQRYAALNVALRPASQAAPLSFSVGYGKGGAVLGAALALKGYGEGWLHYRPEADNNRWAVGAELIPADYWKLSADYDSRGLALEALYALPLNAGEGRPYRLLAGYSPETGWYAGGLRELGAYSLRLTASARAAFSLAFESRW